MRSSRCRRRCRSRRLARSRSDFLAACLRVLAVAIVFRPDLDGDLYAVRQSRDSVRRGIYVSGGGSGRYIVSLPGDLIEPNSLRVFMVDRRVPCDMDTAIAHCDAHISRRIPSVLDGSGDIAGDRLVVARVVRKADPNLQILPHIGYGYPVRTLRDTRNVRVHTVIAVHPLVAVGRVGHSVGVGDVPSVRPGAVSHFSRPAADHNFTRRRAVGNRGHVRRRCRRRRRC